MSFIRALGPVLPTPPDAPDRADGAQLNRGHRSLRVVAVKALVSVRTGPDMGHSPVTPSARDGR